MLNNRIRKVNRHGPHVRVEYARPHVLEGPQRMRQRTQPKQGKTLKICGILGNQKMYAKIQYLVAHFSMLTRSPVIILSDPKNYLLMYVFNHFFNICILKITTSSYNCFSFEYKGSCYNTFHLFRVNYSKVNSLTKFFLTHSNEWHLFLNFSINFIKVQFIYKNGHSTFYVLTNIYTHITNHQNQDIEYFYHSKKFPMSLCSQTPSPQL